MAMLIQAAIILVTASAAISETELHPLSDAFIESINKQQSSWRAGRNFDVNTPMSYITSLLGVRFQGPVDEIPVRNFHPSRLVDIPESFDAREHWPKCKSLRHIRDQSECGSCWAVAAAAAMTDRICIQSDGNITTSVSAADLMSCCSFCGFGCNGGSVSGPWLWWKVAGIASGGDYKSNDGCINYPFRPCEHHTNGTKPPCNGNSPTPPCKKKCDSSELTYATQITRGKSVYSLNSEKQIQADIMENGPVEAGFSVFADFITYKSGVYQKVQGKLLGGHAVKIIGWGVENETPYWLIANSWNEDWGDQGYFKIRRGNNECGIESQVYAGQAAI